MRIVDVVVENLVNPKMIRVQLKLLLCMLLMIGTNGQYNIVSPWGLNKGGETRSGVQPNVHNWVNNPGYRDYTQYLRPIYSPYVNFGYGQQSPYGYGQQSPYGYGQASPYGYGQLSPYGYAHTTTNFGPTPASSGQSSSGSGEVSTSNVQNSTTASIDQSSGAQPTVVTTKRPPTVNDKQQNSGVMSTGAPMGNANTRSTQCYNIIDKNYPLFASYCSVLPQTTFSLPNFFGHQTKKEANELLMSIRSAPRAACFTNMRKFLCPLFFPACYGERILPCAHFCYAIKQRCGPRELSAINCNDLPQESEFCPTIAEINEMISVATLTDQIMSGNKPDAERTNSNKYTDASSSSSSFSFPSQSSSASAHASTINSVAQKQTSADIHYTGASSSASSDTSAMIIVPTQTSRIVSSTNDLSKVTSTGGSSQDRTVEEDSASSSSLFNGGNAHLVSNSIKSDDSNYESKPVTLQKDNSLLPDNYHSSTYANNANFQSSSYGNNNNYGGESSVSNVIKTSPSSLYDNNENVHGGSAYDNTINMGGSSSSSNTNMNYGDESSFSSTNQPTGSMMYNNNDISSSSYDNTGNIVGVSYNDQASFGNTVESRGPSTFQTNGKEIDGFYFTNSLQPDSSSSLTNNKNYASGESSYNNAFKSAGSNSNADASSFATTNMDSFTASLGKVIKNAESSSFGNNNNYAGLSSSSSSSYGNGFQSAGSAYQADSNKYDGESSSSSSTYGSSSAIKTIGSGTSGSGGNYGGSQYHKSGSYSTSNLIEAFGPPFGFRTTSELIGQKEQKLDLSKCGPTPNNNPCKNSNSFYFELPGYPYCYIQCSLGRMFIKPCPNDLMWNPLVGACDWPTVFHYYIDDGNYATTSYSNSNSTRHSTSSYSYRRKKRSASGRERNAAQYSPSRSLVRVRAPIAPPTPGIVPLPGFSGPIGVPGPLVPPPTPAPSPAPEQASPVIITPVMSRFFLE